MPIVKEKLKPNQKRTLDRIANAECIAKILRDFFNMGFKDFRSFKVIVNHYGLEVEEKKLLDFWTFRFLDNDLLNRVEVILNKLKNE